MPWREDSGRIRLRGDSAFLLGRLQVSAVERDHRPEFITVHFHFDSHSNKLEIFQVHGCERWCEMKTDVSQNSLYKHMQSLQRAKNNPSTYVGESIDVLF